MLPMTPDMTLLDGMVLAVARVRDRLVRTSKALENAGIPYAIAGGNAVAAWVATIDASAVRNTPDVDVLLRRSDLNAAAEALKGAGFIHDGQNGVNIFLDGTEGKPRDAVHVLFAGEKVRPEYEAPAPDVTDSEQPATSPVRVVCLEPLVRMKLTSFRLQDRVHLRDMLEIGLIDAQWTKRFSPALAARLQQLIDTPGQ